MYKPDAESNEITVRGYLSDRIRLIAIGLLVVIVLAGLSLSVARRIRGDLDGPLPGHSQIVVDATVRPEPSTNRATEGVAVKSLVANDYKLLVVGHIRELNGFEGDDSPEMIGALSSLSNAINPLRVIFAGDTILDGRSEQLDYLENGVKPLFVSETVFAIGNHELDTPGYLADEQFKRLFVDENWFEDVEGIRIIVVNSVAPRQHSGFTEEDAVFLENVLDNSYDRAIIVTHNPAWLTDELSELANSANRFSGVDPEFWADEIIHLLVEGNVDLVVAGDAGFASTSSFVTICGIRHYLTGWAERSGAEVLAIRDNGDSLDVDQIDLGQLELGVQPVAAFEFEPQPMCAR